MASSGSLAGLATLRRRHCFLPPKVKVRSPPTRHYDGKNKGRSRPPQIRNLLLGRRVEEFLPGRRAAFTTPTHSQRSCPGVGEVGWRKAPLPYPWPSQLDASGSAPRRASQESSSIQKRNRRSGRAI